MTSFCPTQQNICVSRGDSPVIPVEVRDDQGDLLDLTNHSLVMTVDPSPAPEDDTNNLFQLVIPTISDGSTGIVQFQPTTANTDLAPGVYFYDIQVTTPVPSVRTILAGEFEIQQDVSKI